MLYLCLVWMAVIFLKTSVAREPSCPVCSNYDFEERLLERVIRNELALKDTLEKITETNAKVEETLKRIEKDNSKLNHAIHALYEKGSSLVDKVDAFIVSKAQNVSESVAEMKAAVKSLVEQTTTELGAMKDKSMVPLVLFHARLSTNDHHSYTAQQNIIFKKVMVNEGGGYDSTTGQFTASVAGVYMFMVQYCLPINKWGHLEIVQNARPLQRSAHKGEDYHVCVSIQTFANVATGDKFWVRATYSSDIWQDEDNRWTSFSGLLIRP